MIYTIVIIVVLLLILIRVWRGSDLGFWVITSLFLAFGILATFFFCGWFFLFLERFSILR